MNIGSPLETSLVDVGTAPISINAISGNLLLLFVSQYSSSGATITAPSGWTTILNSNSTAIRSAVFAKMSDGTEGATVSLSGGTFDVSAQAYSISGFSGDIALDIDVSIKDSVNSSGSEDSVDPAIVTADWGAEVGNVYFVAGFSGRTTSTFSVKPAGYTYTEGTSGVDGSGYASNLCVGYKVANTASEDPTVFTAGTFKNMEAITLVLRAGTNAGNVVDAGGYTAEAPLVVDVPSGVVDGDYLLLLGSNRSGTGIFATPAGWTRISAVEPIRSSSDHLNTCIAYRIASSEPANYTLTNDTSAASSAVILAYPNIDGLDVVPSSSHKTNVYNDNSPLPQPITTITDNAKVVAIQFVSNAEITGATPPAGYTLRVDHTPFDDRNILVADKTKTTAGVETVGSWLNVAGAEFGDSSVVTLALSPITENVAPVANDITYSISEDTANGTVVDTFVATDDGTVVSYSVTGTVFGIDNSGVLTLLDNSGLVDGTPVLTTVTATDNEGLTDDAIITVNITGPTPEYSAPFSAPYLPTLDQVITLTVDWADLHPDSFLKKPAYAALSIGDQIDIVGTSSGGYTVTLSTSGLLNILSVPIGTRTQDIDYYIIDASDTYARTGVATETILINSLPVGLPAIAGTEEVGNTLTVDTSAITDTEGLGAFSYQWKRDNVNVSGATNVTYDLGTTDYGTVFTCEVTFTDGQGVLETLISPPTGSIIDTSTTEIDITLAFNWNMNGTIETSVGFNWDIDSSGVILLQAVETEKSFNWIHQSVSDVPARNLMKILPS